MADQVTVDNATNGDYVVSTDDAGASGQVQRVKLTYSADGDATHITADADGLLVNLGSNNDVTVTGTVAVSSLAGTIPVSGTVDVSSLSGTVAVLQSGTWDEVGINDSGNSITVDDGGSSLTVDGTVSVSSLTGTIPVSQTGAPWTVGGTVQVSGVSGTVPVTGTIAGSGNFTVVQSTATNLKVDASGVAVPITDNSGSLTVDNGGTFVVQPGPSTSGGLSIFRSLDLDETEEEAKATAGQVYGWYIANTATSTRFVKFYNATAANVTVGTTTPVLTFPIPGNSSDDVGANALGAMGIVFDTAITVAATTGVADNDTGAPGANEVIVNIFYK